MKLKDFFIHTYIRLRSFSLVWLARLIFNFFRYRVIPVELFIKIQYKKRMGFYPNLKNPQLFSEKLQWLKLNDKRKLLVNCVDKYYVREFVKVAIGDKYLVPLLYATKDVSEINENNAPDIPFIIKVNHDSGGVFIVKDKNIFNFENARQKLSSALKTNYYYQSKEWPYKNIEKRIIIEQLLLDEHGNIPNDIKVHCFHGKVEFVEIMTNRGSIGGVKEHCLTRDFVKQPFLFSYPQSSMPLEVISNWDEIMDLAEVLSHPFNYVRVDFYNVNNKIYFGELTFYPHSGYDMLLQPRNWDLELGNKLDLRR